MSADSSHVPPLRFGLLTGIYDAVMATTTRERRFKQALLKRLQMPATGTLLDLGCGTGTMTLWARAAWPEARIIGVDADHKALSIARRKQHAVGAGIDFRQADAAALPIAASSVDAVLCSLFFHHLTDKVKVAALQEVARVLRPGGLLLVADWGRPTRVLTAVGFFLVRCLDGFDRTRTNAVGGLPALVSGAGFPRIEEFDRVAAVWGEIQLLSATLDPEPIPGSVSEVPGATEVRE